MEDMRTDPSWVVSLAKAADAGSLGSWCGVHRGLAQQRLKLSLRALSKNQALSAAMLSRIECCFCPEKVDRMTIPSRTLGRSYMPDYTSS